MIVSQPAMVQNYLQLYRNTLHTRGTPTLHLLAIAFQGRHTMYVFSTHPTANRRSPIVRTLILHIPGLCQVLAVTYTYTICLHIYMNIVHV